VFRGPSFRYLENLTVQWRNDTARYGVIAQFFHWSIVALIINQFILAAIAEDLPLGLEKLALMARHKSWGMTVLCLAVMRLAWRIFSPPPLPPESQFRWEQRVAKVTHAILYALLFIMPVSGWLTSSAANFSVSVFGWFTLPDMVEPDKALQHRFGELHELLAVLLVTAVTLHVAAALYHHFRRKDDVLRRMLPFTSQRETR